MNHEEIENCVIKAKTGDNEAIVLLLDQYKPFIFKAGKQFNIKDNEIYDLVQTGYVALIKAIAKYRIGSNTFSSYAYTTIKNSLKYLARSNKKHSIVTSINEKASVNSTTEFVDTLASDENIEIDFLINNDISILKGILENLPEDEFELIFLVYYNGVTLKTYAERKGLNYLNAVRKKDKILASIKNKYSEKDISAI